MPHRETYIVERFGKYSRTLDAGLHVLLPVVDRISYVHTLKEQVLEIPDQSAITKDNVAVTIDGILFFRVDDPLKASYGVDDPELAIMQIAQTTMRSEIGALNLDRLFAERDQLNSNIVDAIAPAAGAWGISVLRYEIKDIAMGEHIMSAMDLQSSAERKRRQVIIEASGASEALLIESRAAANAIKRVGQVVAADNGRHAVEARVAQQYIAAFTKVAERGESVVVPGGDKDGNGTAAMLAQAAATWQATAGAPANAGHVEAGHGAAPVHEQAPHFDEVETNEDFLLNLGRK